MGDESNYSYCYNNPLVFVDPLGLQDDDYVGYVGTEEGSTYYFPTVEVTAEHPMWEWTRRIQGYAEWQMQRELEKELKRDPERGGIYVASEVYLRQLKAVQRYQAVLAWASWQRAQRLASHRPVITAPTDVQGRVPQTTWGQRGWENVKITNEALLGKIAHVAVGEIIGVGIAHPLWTQKHS